MQQQSSHFDITDEYVASCGRASWTFEKSAELAQRASRLKRAGKENAFTLRLRTFIIHCQFHNKEMLSEIMLTWGAKGPFYDPQVKAAIKKLMGE